MPRPRRAVTKKEVKPKKETPVKEDEIDDSVSSTNEIENKPTDELIETPPKGDSEEEETQESDKTVNSKRGKRGRKPKNEPPAKKSKLEISEDKNGDSSKRAKGKPAKPLANKSSTDYDKIDFKCIKKSKNGEKCNFKISSWNVDGIRAWLNKGGLTYIEHEKPDILCLQETKCSEEKLPPDVKSVPGYHKYWASGEKEGYAGVGVFSKKKPKSVKYGLGLEELDTEGRIITAEFEEFYLICTYVPNAGRGLVTLPKRLEWNDAFHKYVKKLDEIKPVIICGDMNVSHKEIDLANPKTNKKNAGFTQQERDGMTDLLNDGFVDTFRSLYPEKTGAYTFWTYMMNSRAKNVGWRLDYHIVSERFSSQVCDNLIRNEVFGSDHCPITLCLKLKLIVNL